MKNWKKGRYGFLVALVLMLTLLMGVNPGSAWASTSAYLDLTFASISDYNLITGETRTINFTLSGETTTTTTDQVTGLVTRTTSPYKATGPYTAYISDPDGKETSYATNGSSISNVTLDKAGTYYLYISDSTESASGTIYVTDAKTTITGKLSLGYNSTVTVKLMDSDGNILPRKSVNVDASNVGGTVSSYTTLYDGTFGFSMTPLKMGTVKLTIGGHIIGSLDVTPAYSTSNRIGDNTSDNATRSVLVSQQGWSSSKYVILTRDDVVADAMVAVPMSNKYDAPILMTPTDQLNPYVINEIKRLGAGTVFIIGGEGAISSSVENQLKGYGIYPNRLAGNDRYETATKIASWVGSPGTVYLAYGYGEPDALAASALAAEQGIPILLTDTNTLPESTSNALATLAPRNLKLLGGTGVISAELEQSLANSYVVDRWGGADRYATEQVIFQNYFGKQQASNSFPAYFTSAYVAPNDVTSGTPYGDALFTAALAAKNNGFVITLPSNEIPSSIRTFLLYNKVFIPSGTVVGNSSAISYQLEAQLNQLLAR